MNTETRKVIRKIQDKCRECQEYEGAPRILKITVGPENLQFNHRVVVDTMFITSRPVSHLVDESTHFKAAYFLRNQSANEIRKTIYRFWIYEYIGPLITWK